MNNYVFGYGSLIEKESRTFTIPNVDEVIPAQVRGITRGWWARTKVMGVSTTYLGCLNSDSDYLKKHDAKNFVNGIIFKVSDDDLKMLDDREKNYKRVKLQHVDIVLYNEQSLKDLPVWVYLNEFKDEESFLHALPSKDFPIVQSYVDICINGCLEIEEFCPAAKQSNFLIHFISSTIFWDEHWANDRIFPRRPHIYCKNAFKIDTLLQKHLPDKTIFDKIYIE